MNKFYYILPLFLLAFIQVSCKEKEVTPFKFNTPRNIMGVASYRRTFGDTNDTHLSSAKKIGIIPIDSREQADSMKNRLLRIRENGFFAMDSLTYSIPYLVPQASVLLTRIGSNFLDSLESKGLNPNLIIVTSVLRTKTDVKRLCRRNGNASLNSAHYYGTTFDISYRRFKKVEGKYPMQDVGTDTLKFVLAEVLRDLKKWNRCYVKYELKQGCFHITAR